MKLTLVEASRHYDVPTGRRTVHATFKDEAGVLVKADLNEAKFEYIERVREVEDTFLDSEELMEAATAPVAVETTNPSPEGEQTATDGSAAPAADATTTAPEASVTVLDETVVDPAAETAAPAGDSVQ